MLKLKEDVDCRGLCPEILLAIQIVHSHFIVWTVSKDVVITSICDSKHGRNSLHYIGQAVDFRIKGIDLDKPRLEVLKSALPNFDIILEDDHLHIEFQPKKGLNL